MMRLSFSTLGCPAWTLEQIAGAAADYGYQGVDFRGLGSEIDITKLPAFNDGLDATLALFRGRGLELPCYNTSVTLLAPTPLRWQEMLEECQRYAKLAGRTATKTLRLFIGRVPKELAPDQALATARRHLRQVAKICRAQGCLPVLETHDDWVTSARLLEVLHEMAPEEVGVLWDIEHTCKAGESPADTVAGLKRFIRHTHFKDCVFGKDRNDPRLMGQGNLPVVGCIEALKGIGYDGWLCLESEKRWHADAPDPEVIFPQYAQYMRGMVGKA
jgi:sugar phosphate isomerase/epimerase